VELTRERMKKRCGGIAVNVHSTRVAFSESSIGRLNKFG